MAIDYQKLKAWRFEELVHRYTVRDTILYALGAGYGTDPTDPQQLRFLYEDGLMATPTMAAVLGYPGTWLRNPATGVDWRQVLHGEQTLVVHRPLPVEGETVSRTRVDEIIDKGEGRGAVIYTSRDIVDRREGDVICSVGTVAFCRADGGFGGPNRSSKPAHEVPSGPPEVTCDLPTLPQAALIYRLSGDYNPLHIDPEVARIAGFPKPILHGLATYGVAGHALIKSLCNYDPTRLKRMDVRFSSVVYPGETIRTEMWRTGPGQVAFRSKVVERDAVVLNNGYAELT